MQKQDSIGFNLYGMLHSRHLIEEKEGIQLFKDATDKRKEKQKMRRNKERAQKRALMTL